jgi:ribose transport system permease protein
MTAVIITGGIDLSVGSVAVPVGHGHRHDDVVNIPAGDTAGLAASRHWPANGILIAYVGMPPFVVTLGMMSLARSPAMVLSRNQRWSTILGHDHAKPRGARQADARLVSAAGGVVGPDTRGRRWWLFTWLLGIVSVPNPAVFLLLFAHFRLLPFAGRMGRYILPSAATSRRPELTRRLNAARRVKASVYMLSALMAGIAGILQVGWARHDHHRHGTGMELIVIAAVVIGARQSHGRFGTAFGAVVGAVLIR